MQRAMECLFLFAVLTSVLGGGGLGGGGPPGAGGGGGMICECLTASQYMQCLQDPMCGECIPAPGAGAGGGPPGGGLGGLPGLGPHYSDYEELSASEPQGASDQYLVPALFSLASLMLACLALRKFSGLQKPLQGPMHEPLVQA